MVMLMTMTTAKSNALPNPGNAKNDENKKILISAVFFILLLLISGYSVFKVKKDIESYSGELLNVSISIGKIDYEAMQKYLDRFIFDLPLIIENRNEKSILLYNVSAEVYIENISVENRSLHELRLSAGEEKDIILRDIVLMADKLDRATATKKGENPEIRVKLSAEKPIKIKNFEIKRIKLYGNTAEKKLSLLEMFGGKTQAEFSRELIEKLTGKKAEVKEH